MSYDSNRIGEKLRPILDEHPRIQGHVMTLYQDADGMGGVMVTLSYRHRTGQDDHREMCVDDDCARIMRPTLNELNLFGVIAQQLAELLPELDVSLDHAFRGKFQYLFVPRKS